MRKVLSGALLFLMAAPAFAQISDSVALPEPDALSLVALGAVVLFLGRRNKK